MTDDILKYLWDLRKSECSHYITSDMYFDSQSDFLRFIVVINNEDIQLKFFKLKNIDKELLNYAWFEKHKLFNYLVSLVLKDGFSHPNIDSFHINYNANYCVKWLYKSCVNFNKYYKKWIYLILLQANKNFERTFFFAQQNSKYIKSLIQNILQEFEPIQEDYPSIDDFKTWLFPTGVIYKKGLRNLKVESVEDFYSILFEEITYIRANYQMCIIFEDKQYLKEILRLEIPYI